MGTNPVYQLMGMLQGGGNPIGILSQMAGQNPAARQTIQLISGKGPGQLEGLARSLAKNAGVSVEEVAARCGVPIPKTK